MDTQTWVEDVGTKDTIQPIFSLDSDQSWVDDKKEADYRQTSFGIASSVENMVVKFLR